MQLLANAEFWIAGLLLVASQVYRSSALKNLVSDVHVFRLRDIIALNSVSSLLNVLGPARIGDFLRVVFLAKRGLGLKLSILVVLIERLFDLVVVLTFAITLSDRSIFQMVLFCASLSILFGVILSLVKFSLPKQYDLLKFNQVRYFVSTKVLGSYFGKLAISWLLALGAAAILNIKKEGFLGSWLDWNANLGEPFTPLISRNQFLLGILLLPLLALLVSTILFRNSTQVSARLLSKVAQEQGSKIGRPRRLNSRFSGSGCDIFLTSEVGNFSRDSKLSLICKVEPKSRLNFLQTQAQFMEQNAGIFDFPRVYRVARTANFNLLVMENIQDFSTGLQSENYAEKIRGGAKDNVKPYLHEVVSFLIKNKFHLSGHHVRPSIDSLVSRVDRVAAFCSIQGAYGSKSGKYVNGFESTLKEITRLLRKEFDCDIEVPSHGDATLSNFIRQETSSGFRIRSIDPNPRIKIGRIEYDLGKISQSVSSMYEDTMQDPVLISEGISGFISRQSGNTGEAQFLNVIRSESREINIELMHLFHLTHLIRILPYQYKTGPSFVNYWQDVILYQFESKLK